MHKFLKHICTFLSLGIFCAMLFPMYAQAASKLPESGTDLQRFLDWYAAHKDTGGEYFLDGELNLDSGTADAPILLDGTGDIYLYCNRYSLVIQSEVIIDNKNLFISSVDNQNPAVILNDANASLTLKNGRIVARSTVGLYVSEGALICPQGEDRFTISSWLESPTALAYYGSGITLGNLDLYASGTGEVTGITGANLELADCMVSAEAEDDSGNVIGIQADNSIRLSRTSVTAKGDNARSVVCGAGADQIEADSACTFEPEFKIPSESDAQYRVTRIYNPAAVNVPIGMSPEELYLPEVLECEMVYSDGGTDPVPNGTIAVNWNTDNLAARLQEEGECVISGTFSEAQLEDEHIYMAESFRPTITVRVMPVTAMNRIRFSRIEANQTAPFIEIYMVRPYGADSLFIEYSSDGVLWERGYGIRVSDNTRESNILLCDTLKAPTLMLPVYLSKMAEGGWMRAVVNGGPFAGTWESVALNPSDLFTPPGEDGKGGDRGGQSLPTQETASDGESETISPKESQSTNSADTPVFSSENTSADGSQQDAFSYETDNAKSVTAGVETAKIRINAAACFIKGRWYLPIAAVAAYVMVVAFAAGRIFKKKTK